MYREFENPWVRTELDIFNSQHFGLRMGNMSLNSAIRTMHPSEMAEAIATGVQCACHEGFQHLTCRVNTAEKNLANALIQNGFQIADTLVTYCFWLGKRQLIPMDCHCEFKDVQQEEISGLKEIARTSFKIDRFHTDPSLPDDLCDQYYEKWFENSCYGFADKVLAAYRNNTPVGFFTVKYEEGDSFIHMGLIAVNKSERGLGIGSCLEDAALRWAEDKARRNSEIKGFLHGTQIDNLAMQNILMRKGFVLYESQYVLRRKG